MSNIIFVTGTDTDAGKTVLSLLLMHALAGQDAVYLKPVQTGCASPDAGSDPAFIRKHLPGGLPCGMTPAACIHSLRPLPKAPLFAGEPVDFEGLVKFVAVHALRHDTVIAEGAGGVFVPITGERTVLDLALRTGASMLVAGRAGLGTINHTLLTFKAITSLGGKCLGAVLLDPKDEVPMEERAENVRAIESFSGLRVHGVVGRIPDLAHPDPAVLEMLRHIVQTDAI